jgi:hypothetical protein
VASVSESRENNSTHRALEIEAFTLSTLTTPPDAWLEPENSSRRSDEGEDALSRVLHWIVIGAALTDAGMATFHGISTRALIDD